MPSFEDESLKNEQDDPVEVEPASSTPYQSKESPIILEKAEGRLPFDDTSPQEGIGDAFSQDHRDRFQSKAEGRLPNEKTNKVESGKGKPDA